MLYLEIIILLVTVILSIFNTYNLNLKNMNYSHKEKVNKKYMKLKVKITKNNLRITQKNNYMIFFK